ncbi:hypothetical protein GWN42_07130 [candidate division KSB1 bacterium]|nr:hypothetical protein [candidate division KSB1 bacterium]NIU24782.1 hypothetical protein [candidate division KSB1 bacterium]NIU90413.1 hypothetical protein [candidate division KSB1 bacterium]NIV92570.1 hypothetical protein [candidate division KSB1 bacterium]NIW18634.1 hypothetical protein [candidate division KSB1 bacterium]
MAAEIYDSDFCLHGPHGCMQSVQEAYAVQNREYDYHQTGMTHKETIFGGENLLTTTLVEALHPYEKAGPKFVVTSCAPEIIGDDSDKIYNLINEQLPVVKVGGGFQGNHYWGINQSLLALVKKFADPYPFRDPTLVNLIANVGLSRQWRGDVWELKRCLDQLGIQTNIIVCNNVLDDLKLISNAALTILANPEIGELAAQYLRDAFDIPYVCSPLGLPLGLRGTEEWLRQVAEVLEIDKKRTDEVLLQEEGDVRLKLKIGLCNMVFTEKVTVSKKIPVAIIAEEIVAYSWARFVYEEMEMLPVLLGLTTISDLNKTPELKTWMESSNLQCKILNQPDQDELRKAFHETQPEFIIGSSLNKEIGEQLGINGFLHIAYPNYDYVTINEHPFLGYKGLLHASESILNALD